MATALPELLTPPHSLEAERARIEALLDEMSWAWDAGLSDLLDQAVAADDGDRA